MPVKEGDKVVRDFVTRQAKEAGDVYVTTTARSGPHRIFWGHDILSLGKDNPFVIMQKQMPGLKGIVQTIKHLTADTFSKQGLPIPTSSWWDYTYTDKRGVKRVGNKLLDYCNKVYKMSTSKDKINVTGANNDVFNHMFSIHIQDIGTQKLGSVLCDRYLSYKKINNETDSKFKDNICYSGCDIVNGNAIARVINVGKDTEYGKIGVSLNGINKNITPLDKQVRSLVKICSIISFIFLYFCYNYKLC